MVERGSVCLRKLANGLSEEVKFGRFLSNERVTVDELIKSISLKTVPYVKGRHVLAIQDTTSLNYQAHADRTSGLGPIGDRRALGFYVHPMLVVDAQEKACLGLSHIHSWIRPEGKRPNRKLLPIEEKESYRWIETAERSKTSALSCAEMITVVADRESDIYEEWCRIPDEKTHLLTRANRDRNLGNDTLLFSHVNQLPSKGTYKLDVKARKGKRHAHRAELEIRYGEITILRPVYCKDKEAPAKITLRVVDVKEKASSVVENDKPIHWCLLITHRVESTDDALQIVEWYTQRWYVEELFRVLKKQGLNVESSQLEDAHNLRKLAVIAVFAAMRVMMLTLSRDGNSQDATIFLVS